MSGLRLYVHNAHGRHVNGDVRAVRARQERRCDGCKSRTIKRGEWYGIATMYPSDCDFTYVHPDRPWERSNTAARLHLCLDCLGEDTRDLLAVTELDFPLMERPPLGVSLQADGPTREPVSMVPAVAREVIVTSHGAAARVVSRG